MSIEQATTRLADVVFAPRAAEDIRTYFTEHDDESRNFTGRYFARVSVPDPDPNRFLPEDLLAPATLGEPLTGTAVLQLLGRGRHASTDWAALLAAVPHDVHITKVEGRDLLRGRTADGEERPAARTLEHALARVEGLCATQVSMLLHRKRPKLLPLWSPAVQTTVDPGGAWWETVAHFLEDDDTKVRFEAMREDALEGTGVPGADITLIRLLDVVLFMRERAAAKPIER